MANDLQIVIQATDQANAVLGNVKAQLNSLNGVAANAGKQAGQSLSAGMTPGTKAAVQVLQQVSPTLGSIAAAAGPVAAGLAIVTAGVVAYKQAWGLAVQGANFQEVYDAQMKIVGSTAKMTDMLNLMRKATVGTVSDFDLLIIENRALNMGVTQSAEEMANLAAIFTELGDASGMAAKESVSAGFQALGALQTRGLKTIGLSLDETKIWDEYAAKLGTTAAKLDDVQKRAALVQTILATAPNALAEASASYADQVDAMRVAQVNFRTELGLTLQEMLKIAPVITQVLNQATADMQTRRGYREAAAPYIKYAEELRKSGMYEELQRVNEVMYMLDNQTKTTEMSAEQYAAALAAGVPVVAAQINAQQLLASNLYTVAMAAGAAESAIIREMMAGNSAPLSIGLAKSIKSGMPYGSYTNTGPGAYVGMFGQMVTNTSGFGGWTAKDQFDKMAKLGGGGGLSDYEQMLRQQAADMRSLVEQILQPTEVTSQDMADTAAGRYMDKWDEYGRKMRAIAADQGSVWRQMVPQDVLAQGEEAIKGWAEQQEKLFYAGRMPGEVNWGDFVARAKEEIANKQAREAMVQEAMRQLQAAGVSMSGADVQAMIGGTPGASTGVEMAGAFGTGLVANDTALAVTKAFQEQMKAQQETWTLVGALCISWFVLGIKKGITPQTGRDIVNAIFPWMAEKLDEAGYVKGALP